MRNLKLPHDPLDSKTKNRQSFIDSAGIWIWGMAYIDFFFLTYIFAVLVPVSIFLTIWFLNRGKREQMRGELRRQIRDKALFEIRAEAEHGLSYQMAIVDIQCSECGEPAVALYTNQWDSICVEGHQLENVDI